MIKKLKKIGVKVVGKVTAIDEGRMREVESNYEINFPHDYLNLIKELGYFQFTRSVMVKGVSEICNVSIDNNLIPIGDFLKWNEDDDFSITSFLEKYADQIPQNFIPFAEGELGDLLGFYYSNSSEYKVCYWYHEGVEMNDIHVVSSNFRDFIFSIIQYEIDPGDVNNVKHIGPSSKMIELLKKTGKWKGD